MIIKGSDKIASIIRQAKANIRLEGMSLRPDFENELNKAVEQGVLNTSALRDHIKVSLNQIN